LIIILSITENLDHSNWWEAVFFNQKVKVRSIIRNEEIEYMKFFMSKTKIYCQNIIHYKNYIFFFVKPYLFQKANKYLAQLRYALIGKKVLIIKQKRRIIDLIYTFFPNVNIRKLELLIKNNTGDLELLIFIPHFKERGIAVGKAGNYIKIVNEIFEEFIYPVKISCLYLRE